MITAAKATMPQRLGKEGDSIDQIIMDDVIAVESGNQIARTTLLFRIFGVIGVNESRLLENPSRLKKKARRYVIFREASLWPVVVLPR